MIKYLFHKNTDTKTFFALFMIFLMTNLDVQAQNNTITSDSLAHGSKVDTYAGSSKTEQQWTDYQDISDSSKFGGNFVLNNSVDVFGWHPYWNGKSYKNYNFSLLSTIAYFSYELDPKTGSYKTIHDWKTTALIDTAKAVNPNISILLSVTNFGKKNNKEFLGSLRDKGARQQALIDSLQVLLALRGADGIAIDFESVGRLEKRHLTSFIKQLSTSLKTKKYMLVMAVPAEDPHEIYDVKELAPFVDKFVVMSYGYHWEGSKKAGPVAPLINSNTWGNNSVATSIGKYQKLGLPASQMIVGIPYYGELWDTRSAEIPSDARNFAGNWVYKKIRNTFSQKPSFNQESNSVYFSYKRGDNNRDRQLWFEDNTTLSVKYDWINQQKLGGIGIWALGDDDGHTELWSVLADKFATPAPLTKPQQLEATIDTVSTEVEGFISKVTTRIVSKGRLITPIVFLVLMVLLVILFPIAFFIVKVKQIVLNHSKAIYTIFILILLVSLFIDNPILRDDENPIPSIDLILTLAATATLGIFIANLVNSVVFSKENLP